MQTMLANVFHRVNDFRVYSVSKLSAAPRRSSFENHGHHNL